MYEKIPIYIRTYIILCHCIIIRQGGLCKEGGDLSLLRQLS